MTADREDEVISPVNLRECNGCYFSDHAEGVQRSARTNTVMEMTHKFDSHDAALVIAVLFARIRVELRQEGEHEIGPRRWKY